MIPKLRMMHYKNKHTHLSQITQYCFKNLRHGSTSLWERWFSNLFFPTQNPLFRWNLSQEHKQIKQIKAEWFCWRWVNQRALHQQSTKYSLHPTNLHSTHCLHLSPSAKLHTPLNFIFMWLYSIPLTKSRALCNRNHNS